MIYTDLKYLEKDLNEVVDLFPQAENVNFTHLFKENEGKIVNTVVFCGKAYAFSCLLKASNELERKRLIKRFAKLAFYRALSSYYGVNKPWGALTGIRPTKLAYQEIERGEDYKEFLKNTMKVSDEKVALLEDVINSQKDCYEVNENNCDFFVFIPFCPSRCKYCSFITADEKSSKKHVDKYVDCLIKEIDESKSYVKNLRSVYIGGGTPVSLSDENLDKVLSSLDDLIKDVEYTVEAGRPDVITESNVNILLKHGVNRICVNPQTFNEKTLKTIGRNHSVNEVIKAYNLVKDKFIVNMDLIAGLEGENFEDFKHSIDMAISLNPENITVHSLCVKHGSYLAEDLKKLNVEEIEKMIDYSEKALKDAGYKPYYLYRQRYMAGDLENTGYYKNHKVCIYNVDTMEEISNNIACGAGSVSKKIKIEGNEIERYGNPKDVLTYINKIDTIIEEKNKFFNNKH